ncbi:MAG: hypothetical protein ACJAT3_002272 [Akkermansiaceae bacterium]|jgi:hypothetical protein
MGTEEEQLSLGEIGRLPLSVRVLGGLVIGALIAIYFFYWAYPTASEEDPAWLETGGVVAKSSCFWLPSSCGGFV